MRMSGTEGCAERRLYTHGDRENDAIKFIQYGTRRTTQEMGKLYSTVHTCGREEDAQISRQQNQPRHLHYPACELQEVGGLVREAELWCGHCAEACQEHQCQEEIHPVGLSKKMKVLIKRIS